MARPVEVPPLLVGGAQLECRNQFTVARKFGLRQQTRFAMVSTMRGVWFLEYVQCSIDGGYRAAVQVGYRRDLCRPFRTFARQTVKPLPQLQQ